VAVDDVRLAPQPELAGAVHELLAAAVGQAGAAVMGLLAGHDVAPGDERRHRPLLQVEADLAVGAGVAQPHELAGLDEVDLVAAVEPDGVAFYRRPRHGRPVVVVLDVEGRDVVQPPEDHRPAL
jgi:hypothetical protein